MYHLYLILCKDNSIYTGITTDVQRRLLEHKSRRGGHYTKSRGVKKLVYSENLPTRSAALKREAQVKRWPRAKKLDLANLDDLSI